MGPIDKNADASCSLILWIFNFLSDNRTVDTYRPTLKTKMTSVFFFFTERDQSLKGGRG